MHLNISNRHITETIDKAMGNIHVCDRQSTGINTHKAKIDVIILFNIKILSHPSEATLAPLEILYRGINVLGSEIGPKFICKIKLGISRLP